MARELAPGGAGEFLFYQTEDGRTSLRVRIEGDTVWLSQRDMAELFQTTPPNITLHIRSIYEEGELVEAATRKEYLQVRSEGGREVHRTVKHWAITGRTAAELVKPDAVIVGKLEVGSGQ